MYAAGTASEVITPDEPLWMAGYAARTAPSHGTISDLYATALALDDGVGGRLVIVSIDLIAVTPIITDRVYEAVEQHLGLPRERLILAASHTHFGPEVRPDKAKFFKIPPEFAAKIEATAHRIADAIVRVIVKASSALSPVKIFAHRTQAEFAHNRRRDGVKGGTPSKEDVLDRDVPVLEIVDAATRGRKAIVFAYACHNTTIDPQDRRYCGDWAGFAKAELQRLNAGSAALFITGCGADQNPEPRGTMELSQSYGLALANAVQQSVTASNGVEITGPIRAAMSNVALAMQPVTRSDLETAIASDDPPRHVKAKFLLDQLDRGEPLIAHYPAPLQAIRFGNELLMIVLPGEPVVDWSHQFKREFASVAKFIWVAGYCNDMFGYLPTRRIQQEGGYEAGRANLWSWLPSAWTEDVEKRITSAVREIVKSLQ